MQLLAGLGGLACCSWDAGLLSSVHEHAWVQLGLIKGSVHAWLGAMMGCTLQPCFCTATAVAPPSPSATTVHRPTLGLLTFATTIHRPATSVYRPTFGLLTIAAHAGD